jgi:quinol-cytochrome oxidoreductase complex cytochrome b subunit
MDERAWMTATRAMLLIVEVILGVLVVTGVVLAFRYQPSVSGAFANVAAGAPHVSAHSQARTVHRVAALALIPAFGGLAIAAAGLALVRHRAWRLVPVVVAGIGVVAAFLSGVVLPWDQLAINRVTVGTNIIRGYGTILFGHDVKYVLVGNTEIGPSNFARWFWVHVVVTALIIVVSLVIVARHATDDTQDPEMRMSASSDEAVRTP